MATSGIEDEDNDDLSFGTIPIRYGMEDDAIRLCEAVIVGGTLAVHPDSIRYSRSIEGNESWSITHTKSGFNLGRRFADPDDALSCAKAMLPLCNWDRVNPRDASDKSFVPASNWDAIREAMKLGVKP